MLILWGDRVDAARGENHPPYSNWPTTDATTYFAEGHGGCAQREGHPLTMLATNQHLVV
jgi:hypothetical protein